MLCERTGFNSQCPATMETNTMKTYTFEVYRKGDACYADCKENPELNTQHSKWSMPASVWVYTCKDSIREYHAEKDGDVVILLDVNEHGIDPNFHPRKEDSKPEVYIFRVFSAKSWAILEMSDEWAKAAGAA